jgi:hypothetical protein
VGDNGDAFPNDPTEWADSDGDGVGDNADAFPNDPTETTDTDGDGVGDNSDAFPTDPTESVDTDGDGVGDNADAFPGDPTETVDTDGDGIGNNADLDDDADGLSDAEEQLIGTNPLETDTDGDGLLDGFEVANGFDPLNPGDQNADPDGDGLDNLTEQSAGTDPLDPDSDGDGASDGEEVASGSNPNVARTPLSWAAVSPDLTVQLGGVMVYPEDVAMENLLGVVVPTSLGSLPSGVNVTAYHLLWNNDQLFSLDATALLAGGLAVEPEDVVRYDGNSYALEFDGSAEGIPFGISVDAVSKLGSALLLSFDKKVILGVVTARDEDLVRFDGSGFALFFNGSAAGVPGPLDLDAAHHMSGSKVALSFDGSGSLPGVTFEDEDVLEYDLITNTWEITYDGSAEHASGAPRDAAAGGESGERPRAQPQTNQALSRSRSSPSRRGPGPTATSTYTRRSRAWFAARDRRVLPGARGHRSVGVPSVDATRGLRACSQGVRSSRVAEHPGYNSGIRIESRCLPTLPSPEIDNVPAKPAPLPMTETATR